MSLDLKVLDRKEGIIIINYEEMKKNLALELAKFKGVVFTEDKITEAKKTRASLNTVATAIDNRRKQEKQAFMRGFEVFEEQTKELTKMVKDVSDEINKQVKTFEDNEKQEKTIQIQEIWLELDFDKIELKQIWNDKWLNKGATLKDVKKELESKIQEIDNDLSSIAFLCSDDKQKATIIQTKYLLYLDKGRAISEYQQEELAKQKLEEKNNRVVEEIKVVEIEVEKVEPEPVVEDEPQQTRELYNLTFKVYGTAVELQSLSKFLKDNGYKYERLS